MSVSRPSEQKFTLPPSRDPPAVGHGDAARPDAVVEARRELELAALVEDADPVALGDAARRRVVGVDLQRRAPG